jgi:hypothetical protein
MKNCYAVVRKEELGEDLLLAIYTDHCRATRHAKDLRDGDLIVRSEDVKVIEVVLNPVDVEQESPLARLEHEVRTLRTLLTSLQGRVAELSKVSTPPY